ncbi:MAG: site-specific DNA-methyltransferase [Phycisphaeraceae bacterium]
MPTLDWIGKSAVKNHHRHVPYRLLHCDGKLSAGDKDAGNLLVQGDNLEALKALLPYYAGQVKCIYIDPPYNTGNEGWVYNDNVNSPEIRQWLDKTVGKEAEDLSRHDKWLCMMYPRLALLKEFLREDGAIFISIDDNEVHSLRLLMNEVFGVTQFVATIAWQKRYSRENRGAIGDVHEYLVVYAKNPELFAKTRNRVPIDEKQAKVYKNPNSDPRGRWRAIPMTAQGYRPNQMYSITTPSGKVIKPPKGRCWSTIEPEFEKLRAEGRIWFGKKGDSAPGIIRYLDEVPGFVPWTWWPHDEVGHTDEAKKEILALNLDGDIFDTPKPTRLIKRVLQIAADKDSLVLDSFAGSGTTGQAVLDLNKVDGGNRRFILVEMDDDVCQKVTAQRLTRVVNGYERQNGDKASQVEPLGGGFRYCVLGKPLFDERGEIADEVRFTDLAAHVFFTETGLPIPKRARADCPLLGVHDGKAIYLLFNGVLGDKRPHGGNVLTHKLLESLPPHPGGDGAGERIIYGEACRIGADRLKALGIRFKQLPYEIKVD